MAGGGEGAAAGGLDRVLMSYMTNARRGRRVRLLSPQARRLCGCLAALFAIATIFNGLALWAEAGATVATVVREGREVAQGVRNEWAAYSVDGDGGRRLQGADAQRDLVMFATADTTSLPFPQPPRLVKSTARLHTGRAELGGGGDGGGGGGGGGFRGVGGRRLHGGDDADVDDAVVDDYPGMVDDYPFETDNVTLLRLQRLAAQVVFFLRYLVRDREDGGGGEGAAR
jgi:hypothetical protein